MPTSKGRLLAAFLQKFFSKWVDFQFTSGMEERLDDISAGNGQLQAFLSTFWYELEQSLKDVDDVKVQQVRPRCTHRHYVGHNSPAAVSVLDAMPWRAAADYKLPWASALMSLEPWPPWGRHSRYSEVCC